MARNADQIVTEQLGQLHLNLIIAQARAEKAEDKVAELTARNAALEAQLGDAPKDATSEEMPVPEDLPT